MLCQKHRMPCLANLFHYFIIISCILKFNHLLLLALLIKFFYWNSLVTLFLNRQLPCLKEPLLTCEYFELRINEIPFCCQNQIVKTHCMALKISTLYQQTCQYKKCIPFPPLALITFSVLLRGSSHNQSILSAYWSWGSMK